MKNKTSIESYPFRRFKIKNEDTIKRSININKLILLFNYNGTDGENWARDIAKIIFFLIGINVIDL
ncbi:hypothetical protein D0T57_15430 [Dysgonomonas sp. 511]|nr:hypothetical protein [Dysgonomonas sp. 511]